MIVPLSLSQSTIRNLKQINMSQSQAIEILVRTYQVKGFPAPYIVNDRSGKVVINLQITPYVFGILEGFNEFCMSPSQVIDWLTKVHIDSMRAEVVEVHVGPVQQTEPKSKFKVQKTKQSKVKQATYPEKKPFVHTQKGNPIVKKVKIKPVKR
jgi:hypothetical protein